MSMYIYKNNQQSGPFEEAKILEMLKSGLLSTNDLAIRQGEREWLPLGTMFSPSNNPVNFSNLPNNQQIQSQPQKSGGVKFLLFGLLGLGSLVVLAAVGIVGFFVLSANKSFNSKSLANTQTNRDSNSANPSSSSSSSEMNFKALQIKSEELAKMSPPQKIETSPVIKGKVAIVEKDKFEAKIKGFDYTGKEYFDSDIESYGIAKVRLATRPEEIDTLIQIFCSKGNLVGYYEGGIKGYANNCKVSIIDYKTPAVIAQASFTNSSPPKSVSTIYKTSGEYIFLAPREVDEYIASFPLDKLANPTAGIPFNDDGGRYGKYKPFKDLAGELSRTAFPVNIDSNAVIKGKIAVAVKEASGRAELKGFDVYGKEISRFDYERWGIGRERMAEKAEEIDTLIKVNCKKGSRIGSVKKTIVYSNQCELSIVDYKTSTTVFQKTFENKEMRNDIDTEIYPTQYVALYPSSEIDEFIKGFPKS